MGFTTEIHSVTAQLKTFWLGCTEAFAALNRIVFCYSEYPITNVYHVFAVRNNT